MKRTFVITGFVATLLLASLTSFAQSQSRDDLLKEIETKLAELSVLEKRLLAPAEEDRTRYMDFLTLPETGLIRLLPREKKMLPTGDGSYYSFTSRSHGYTRHTDISLEQGELTSGGFAGANYGMMTNIGDVPLETVSLETPAARVLAAHRVATEEPQARVEHRRVSAGTSIEGVVYRTRLPLQLNSTYLMRAVNYDASDTLVAIRVVRIDKDGSATILWRVLQTYPVPLLARSN